MCFCVEDVSDYYAFVELCFMLGFMDRGAIKAVDGRRAKVKRMRFIS